MGYGKIKADTLVYDNSGTDTDVTISSLAAKADLNSPTFTGTAVFNDLTVNGTTTKVNSTTLTVDDKNIELGTVDTPTDTTADGGGITLKGATDKEIKWINSTDNWTFNQNIEVTGTAAAITITAGEGNNSSLYLISDDGDDNGDYWCIFNQASDNDLYFKTKTSGSYATAAKVTEEGAVHDSKGDVRSAPREDKTANYTLVASDAGKCITSTHQVTIPSGVLSATYNGDIVTIINNSGSDITIVQGSGMTMYNAADASTGNRTLAQRGMATLYFVNTNVTHISGAGLS